MKQARYRFFLLPLFFVLACVGLYAQVGSEITGIVTDQTGAVIGGAKVVLTNPATNSAFTTTSGDTGLYNISGLIPGDYNLRVSAKGFEAYAQTGIVVNVSGTFRVDAKLAIGAETQTITVVADALAVQADSNVISSLITSEDIGALATENRNMVVLATLGLGVSNNLPDNNNVDSVSASFAISFNGLNNAHNIYLINGAEAYDRGSGGKMAIMPSMDAISEFQVLGSNYPPDYGISSGGTISMSLKSGTNKLHGTLYEENRTTAYDAKKPDSGPNFTAPETHYNIYGGNISGPLFIPNVYNTHRQKTFFFWNEEWRKVIAAGSVTNAKAIDPLDVPVTGHDLTYVAPAFALGTVLKQPKGLTTAQLTACGAYCTGVGNPLFVIPSGMFDPNGLAYLQSGIVPSATAGTGGYNIGLASAPLKVRDDVVRIDHNFNDKWRLLGDYVHDNVAATTNGPFMGWTGWNYSTIQSAFTNPAYMATIRLTGAISPNLLLETSINYDGNKINIIDVGSGSVNVNKPATWSVTPVLPSFGLWPSSTTCGGAPCRQVMPGMSYGNLYGTQEDTAIDPYHNASEDYEPKVDISYTTGRHAFKFGFDYNRYVKNQIMGGDSQGNYTQGVESNDGLMDLLMGISDGYAQQQATPILHYYANTPSAYAMDNWHVTPRLTLQLGLRYDAYPHAVERNNQLSNFVPEDYVPDPNMAFTPNNPQANWSATSGPTTNTYGYFGTPVAGTPVPNPPCLFHFGMPCVNEGNGTYGSSWMPDGATINPSAPGVTSDPSISGGLSFYQNGVELAGRNGVPAGLVRNDYKTLQPRVGFSEDLFGNGKTVLRGGFGTFYERIQLNDIMNGSGDAPFAASLNLSDSYFSQPGKNWNDQTLVAGLPVFRTGYTTLTKTYRAPAVAMYSLGVQHELTPSVIWTVQYVGNVGWHQDGDRQINNFKLTTPMAYRQDAGDKDNQAPNDVALAGVPYWCGTNAAGSGCGTSVTPPYPSDQAAFAQSRNLGNIGNTLVNYPGFSGINQQENDLNVNYNSFQTGVRIQNRWGLSAEVDYTWSHEIDIVNVDETNMANPWSTKYDRGSGTLDRRQMISSNYVYKLPIFNKSQGLIHSIAGGWELAGTFVDVKGLPAVIGWGGNYDPIGLNGGYNNRPNITGKMTYPKTVAKWFDTTKVSAPTPAWLGGPNLGFGNARKDAVVGPGRVNLTTSLYKSFDLSHGVNFMIKGESFNTFNHSEWNAVSTSYNPAALGNFGALTGAYDPRNLQIGGRLTF